MANKSPRGQNFFIEIYPDDPNFLTYKQRIEDNYPFVAILHDKDVNVDTGELKKPHFHYLIHIDGQTCVSTLSYITGVPENYITVRSSYAFSFRYLCHLDQPNKHLYSVDELFGVNVSKQIARYVEKDQNEALQELIVLTMQCAEDERCTFTQYIARVVANDLWGHYRQAQSTFMQIWKSYVPSRQVTTDSEF